MSAVRFNGLERGGSCGACPEGRDDAPDWQEVVHDSLVALDLSAQAAPSALFSASANQILALLPHFQDITAAMRLQSNDSAISQIVPRAQWMH